MLRQIFVLLCLWCCSVHAAVDLEEFTQDFVIETKRVHIAEFPNAFNPSIIRWQNRLLMSFRIVSDVSPTPLNSFSSSSQIGLVWLDDEFNPTSPSQLLEWDVDEGLHPEDGRLICVHERLYIIYSCFEESVFLVHVAELGFDGAAFHIVHNECLSTFQDQKIDRREKNWIPFVYHDALHFAYQLMPHRIYYPSLDNRGVCETVSLTKPSIVWEWGELRGGSPALLVDEDRYLAFFHSSIAQTSLHSKGQSIPHYFFGAYTFSNTSPFEIRQISPEPIVGKNFYHGQEYEPYWHPVRVVFPCGFLMDNQFIWVSYGRQDHECWIVKMDKQGLLDSLIQVSTFD